MLIFLSAKLSGYWPGEVQRAGMRGGTRQMTKMPVAQACGQHKRRGAQRVDRLHGNSILRHHLIQQQGCQKGLGQDSLTLRDFTDLGEF